MTRSAARRMLVVLVAIAFAIVVLRKPLSAALVARGDAVLRSTTPRDAQRYYYRALWFDPGSSDAADRIVFVALITHAGVRSALRIARRASAAAPSNAAIAMDAGLLEYRTRAFADAERDFARAARRNGDARAYAFAAFAARRAGDAAGFARFARRAMALDPALRATHLGSVRA